MKIKQFVESVLKTQGKNTNDAEVSEILSKFDDSSDIDIDALDEVQTLYIASDKDRIKSIKTSAGDQAWKKGEAKIKGEIEERIKSKFGISDELEIDQLIDHVHGLKVTPGTGALKVEDLTQEDLNKHPLVISMQNKHTTTLQAKETEFATKLSTIQKETEFKSIFSEVSAHALNLLETKNPILPADPAKAQKAKNVLLVKELEGLKYKRIDGKIVPLNEDETPLTDEHGNNKTLDSLIGEIVESNFEFKTGEERKSPGNGRTPAPTTKKPTEEEYKGALPKSNDEYLEWITDKSRSVEERASIKRQYEAKLGK